MNHSTSTRTTTSGTGQAITSLYVAGIMFILGYTVVRAGLAEADAPLADSSGAKIQMVVPSEGTLWADFGPSY